MRFFGRAQVGAGAAALRALVLAEAGWAWRALFMGSCEGGRNGTAVHWKLRRDRFGAWLYRRCLLLALAPDKVAPAHNRRAAWVFVAAFATFFAVSGQSSAGKDDRTRNLDRDTVTRIMINFLLSPRQTHIRRRMQNIAIAVLGNASAEAIESLTFIIDDFSPIIPIDISIRKIEPEEAEIKEIADQFVQAIPREPPPKYFETEKPDTFIIFVDDIIGFLSNERVQTVLSARGRSIDASKLKANLGCQMFQFVSRWEITEVIIVVLNSMGNKDVNNCIDLGIISGLGVMANTVRRPMDWRASGLRALEIMKLSVKFLYSDRISEGDTEEDLIESISKMSDREFANFFGGGS